MAVTRRTFVRSLAWGGAALITLAVLALNIIARMLFHKKD